MALTEALRRIIAEHRCPADRDKGLLCRLGFQLENPIGNKRVRIAYCSD